MFEGLDKINWEELEHAYGSARDVPDLIRALAVDDDDIREKTLYTLYGNIWHQGTVYQATPYAVPFLIELVKSPDVTRKYDLLIYLAHLAHGYSYLDMHGDAFMFNETRENDEFQKKLDEELEWVKRTHTAVGEGIEVYFNLLTLSDDDLSRMAVPYVLARFPEYRDKIIPRLRLLLPHEPNRLIRASLILAMSFLIQDKTLTDYFEPYLAPDEDLIVRACSAMAIARIARSSTPLRVVRLLIELLKHSGAIDEEYEQLTWSEGDVVADICTTLMHVGYAVLEPMIPDMVGALGRVDFTNALDCVDALLYIVFDGKPLAEDTSVDQLNLNQRLVLKAILHSPNTWRMVLNDGKTMLNGNISSMMRAYGLPADPDAMRHFLRE